MPAPVSTILRPDIRETFMEFDAIAAQEAFIGRSVFPVVDFAEQAAHFGRIPLEALLAKPETKRGPKGSYNRAEYEFDQIPYACEEHGWEEVVDDALLRQYAYVFDAEMVASQRALGIILRAQEQRIADAVFNTTTWTGSALTTAVGTPWSTPATATPIADVDAAKVAVRNNSGLGANALIIDWEVMKNLRNVDEIIDRIKFSGLDDPKGGNIAPSVLAQVFDLEMVLVAGISAIDESGNPGPGQSATPTAIWDNSFAMVAKVARTADVREPCIGRTVNWSADSEAEGIVEQYRDETVRGDVMRVRHTVDELTLYPEAGHLLTGVTT
jgi:hypothetical protein